MASDLKFKILIIGESAVGKTCITLRYTNDSFSENHLMTIGKFILLQIKW